MFRCYYLLPSAYVVGGKVMFSVCSHLGGAVPDRGVAQPGPMGVPHLRNPPRSDLAGGYPSGRYPDQGVPHLRQPPIRPGWGVPSGGGDTLTGGYPTLGTSCQTWLGVPQLRGTQLGVPHLGYPLSDVAGGYPRGTPPWVPHQTWPRGYPRGGYLILGNPLSDPVGGTLARGYRHRTG